MKPLKEKIIGWIDYLNDSKPLGKYDVGALDTFEMVLRWIKKREKKEEVG